VTITEEQAREEVAAALSAAVAGTDLRVSVEPGLYGAAVLGPRVEAYVTLGLGGDGWDVELWRHEAGEAHGVGRTDDLGDAVRRAVEGAERG
jgi:hypothetical protein